MNACIFIILAALIQQTDSPRQKFSEKWQYNAQQHLFFKTFLFRQSPTDVAYQTQTVVFAPEISRDWVFWFNPATGRYWARCPTGFHPEFGMMVGKGDILWSLLPVEFQGKDLKTIDFARFTPIINRIDHPLLPGSPDKVKIEVLPLGKANLPPEK